MKKIDTHAYVKGILDGDRRMLSKAITLIESSLVSHQQAAFDIMEQVLPHTGNSVRLGITGVPGAGKSTFIEKLGVFLINKGHNVSVIAVDPSSRQSGGSVLGDKTRMEKLAAHENAFIRPSPAGEVLGGVAGRTREVMLVCEAAGFDVILVETVGAGQSDIQVESMVDFFLVLMIAGAGDELQGIKKGVLELADAIAVNKAEKENLKAVQIARTELEAAMQMVRQRSSCWKTPVMTCSAIEEQGLEEIWESVLDHQLKMRAAGEFEKRRKNQSVQWMWELTEEGLKRYFKESEIIGSKVPKISQQVADGKKTAFAAAKELLACVRIEGKGKR